MKSFAIIRKLLSLAKARQSAQQKRYNLIGLIMTAQAQRYGKYSLASFNHNCDLYLSEDLQVLSAKPAERQYAKQYNIFLIMAKYKVGDIVMVSPYNDNDNDNDNDNYDSFRSKKLRITNVATSEHDHPGYDSSMKGQGLYDFVIVGGEEVDASLYDYELVKIK